MAEADERSRVADAAAASAAAAAAAPAAPAFDAAPAAGKGMNRLERVQAEQAARHRSRAAALARTRDEVDPMDPVRPMDTSFFRDAVNPSPFNKRISSAMSLKCASGWFALPKFDVVSGGALANWLVQSFPVLPGAVCLLRRAARRLDQRAGGLPANGGRHNGLRAALSV